VWWIPVVKALRRLRQEDQEFKASLRYMVRPVKRKKEEGRKKKKKEERRKKKEERRRRRKYVYIWLILKRWLSTLKRFHSFDF
jgi:hypothetical protein